MPVLDRRLLRAWSRGTSKTLLRRVVNPPREDRRSASGGRREGILSWNKQGPNSGVVGMRCPELVEGPKRGYGVVLFVAFCISLVFFSSGVESAKKKGKKDSKNEPIHIVSDRLEVNQGKREIIFLGHVMAKKGDLTVLGDRMTVIYRSSGKKSGTKSGSGNPASDISSAQQIEKILVEGNVKISKGDIVAIGNKATYYQSVDKLVLEGNPRVSRGGDFISGRRVIILLKENKSIVEGGRNEPVKATIHPKSGKLISQ